MREKFLSAMDDDFNTGSAISVLFDSLRLLNRHIDQHGLAPAADPQSPARSIADQGSHGDSRTFRRTWFVRQTDRPKPAAATSPTAALLDGVVRLLIDLRKEARERKDYATGDAIRDRLDRTWRGTAGQERRNQLGTQLVSAQTNPRYRPGIEYHRLRRHRSRTVATSAVVRSRDHPQPRQREYRVATGRNFQRCSRSHRNAQAGTDGTGTIVLTLRSAADRDLDGTRSRRDLFGRQPGGNRSRSLRTDSRQESYDRKRASPQASDPTRRQAATWFVQHS